MQGIHALRAAAKFRFLDSKDTKADRRHRPSTIDLRRDARWHPEFRVHRN